MPQDIYRTRERDRSAHGRPLATPLDFERWVIRTHGSHWRSLFLVGSLLALFGVLIGVVLYQQHLLILRSRSASATSVSSPPVPPTPSTPLVEVTATTEWDPTGRWTLDDHEDIIPEPPPKDEYPPVTTRWILQAARALRQAEAAYNRGEWDAAIHAYHLAKRYVPDLKDVDARLGLCYLRKKEFAHAEESFGRAIEFFPTSTGLLNNLGVARLAQGKLPDAEEAFLAALNSRPDYLPAARNLALLKYRAGIWAEAAERLRTLSQLLPEDAELTLMQAISLIRLEQWEESVNVLRDAVKRWPGIAPIQFRLAQSLSHLGGGDEAMEILQRAVQLIDPSRSLAWLARTEFDRLRVREDFQQLIQELTKPR